MVSFIRVIEDAVAGESIFEFGHHASRRVQISISAVKELLSEQRASEGNPGAATPLEVAAAATMIIQMAWDVRTPFSEYDPEDPDVLNDPLRPTAFWAREVPEEAIGHGLPRSVAVWRPTSIVGGTPTHVLERPTFLEITWIGGEFNTRTRVPDVVK